MNGKISLALLSVLAIGMTAAMIITPAYAQEYTWYIPKAIVTVDFPTEFVIGETVIMSYSYEWPEEDWEYLDDRDLSKIVYRFELPSEFSANTNSTAFRGDRYTTHTTNWYWIESPTDSLSGSGQISITMNEEMMYDYDLVTMDLKYHQLVKTENGAKILTKEELGHSVVSGLKANPTNEIEVAWEIDYYLLEGKVHVPEPRPQPRAQSNESTGYLEEFAWEHFAEFLKLEQGFGRASNVTQYLLGNGLSQRFVDDYLTAYPEFRTQSVQSGTATTSYADTPLSQWNSGMSIEQIQCTDGKILMQSPNGKPACLTENSVKILADRGYTILDRNDNKNNSSQDTAS